MKQLSLITLIAALILSIPQGWADFSLQQDDDGVFIAYVTGHGEVGAGGLSRFTNFFGSAAIEISLTESISPLIDLVILAGPQAPSLTDGEVGRLWVYLQNGGSLLILNDPPPKQGLNADSALNDLLWEDYGIRWRDDLIVKNWFTYQAAESVRPDEVTILPRLLAGLSAEGREDQLLTKNLFTYNLPVFFWHARSLDVQSPALHGEPVELLRTTGDMFGETHLNRDSAPEVNIGEDVQGQLVIAAAVEDFQTGARIAVVGDSEIFKDGFGLERTNGNFPTALYSGNWLFTYTLAQWLLKRPIEEIPLPSENFWLGVDGYVDDWENISSAFIASEPSDDPSIREVRIARSDRRIYLLLRTENVYQIPSSIVIQYAGQDYAEATPETPPLQAEDETLSQGTRFAINNDLIEATFPLDVLPIGTSYTITSVCISVENIICAETNVLPLPPLGLEPRGKRILDDYPTARIIASNGLDVRVAPDIYANGLVKVEYGSFVNIIKMTSQNDWAEIWADGIVGWVPVNFLQFAHLNINVGIDRLEN